MVQDRMYSSRIVKGTISEHAMDTHNLVVSEYVPWIVSFGTAVPYPSSAGLCLQLKCSTNESQVFTLVGNVLPYIVFHGLCWFLNSHIYHISMLLLYILNIIDCYIILSWQILVNLSMHGYWYQYYLKVSFENNFILVMIWWECRLPCFPIWDDPKEVNWWCGKSVLEKERATLQTKEIRKASQSCSVFISKERQVFTDALFTAFIYSPLQLWMVNKQFVDGTLR